jgi:hypothetical protein
MLKTQGLCSLALTAQGLWLTFSRPFFLKEISMPNPGIKCFLLATIAALTMTFPAHAQESVTSVAPPPEVAPMPADPNMPIAQPVPMPTQVVQEKPLLVIRFTKPEIHYQNTLNYAVIKAKTANPQVRFRILSYAPEGKNSTQTERNNAKAKANVRAIADEIMGLGVAPEQVLTNLQSDPALDHQEVQIFLE